ncbi:MAG: VanZ family protein [Coriobacteriia bacterium]|nr:VanZ family protein [Coriobacteriia bacterium]
MDHARLLLLAPVLLVYLGFRVRAGMRMRDAALWALLGVYALWAAGLLFFPWVIDPVLRESHRVDSMRYWVNLVPFATIWPQLHGAGSSPLRQLVGNCGLLFPLGLLGPLVMPSLRRAGRLALVALAVSVGIELLQFAGTLSHLLLRSADVDDVILNVAGALLGWLVWAACSALWRRIDSGFADDEGARDPSN